MSKLDFSDLDAFVGNATTPAAPAQSGGDPVSAFVAQVAPAAQAAAKRLGVDPAVLIGQWGLETGWGKSVVPGTNNLGNIKDVSGSGVAATDNMTGSRDRYRQYASLADFGTDYAGLIERRYSDAVGAGSDAQRYAETLKRGGYAEDPGYVSKLMQATEMVRKAGGAGQAAPASGRNDARFGLADDKGYSDAPFAAAEAGEKAARKQAEIDSEGLWDATKHGFGEATRQIPQLIAGAGAALGEVLGVDTLRDAGLEYVRKSGEEAAEDARPYASFTEAMKDGDMARWLSYATGYGVNQILQSVATGGIGSVVGKAGLTGLLKGTAERVALDALQRGATKAVALKAGAAAAERAAMKYGAALGMYSNSFVQELGSIYPDAVEQAQASGDPLDMARVFGASVAAAALEAAPEIGIAGKLLDGAGKGAASYLGRAAATVPKMAGIEGGTEYAQTGVEQWGAQRPLDTPEAQQERVDSAAMGAVMGGPMGAIEAIPAPKPPAPQSKPNSPLTNAASIAQASGAVPPVPPAVPGMTPGGEGDAQAATPGVAEAPVLTAGDAAEADAEPIDPFGDRVATLAQTIDDKAFIRALRGAPGYGKESVEELLSAWAKAKNPTFDPMIRERALNEIEEFVGAFARRPNFTMGGSGGAATGTDVVPSEQQPAGPDAPRLEAPTFAEKDITPRPAGPSAMLETEQALQAKRNADAAYDQAFQDLVKAEQLGAADTEIAEYQRALDEARAQRQELDARLEEIQRNIAAGREQQTAAKRAEVLDAILADPETANAAPRFTAELQRQGFKDIVPNESEMSKILRFEELRAATAEQEQSDVEPAVSNELDPYSAPRPAVNTVRTDHTSPSDVTALLAQGWKLNGKTLQHPKTGKRRILNARELEAVRAAKGHGNELSGVADGVPEAAGTQPVRATGRAKVGGNVDAGLTERAQPYVDELRAMAQDAGWAERGGLLIRGADGNATARTKWIPRAEWFLAGMQESPDALAQAIESVLSGGAAYAKDRRTIGGMIDWLEAQRAGREPDENSSMYEFEALGYEDMTPAAKSAVEAFEELTEAEAMAALGFTQGEIDETLGTRAAGEGTVGGVASGRAEAGGGADSEAFGLTRQTPEELAAQAAEVEAAERRRKEEARAAELKAKADAEVSTFTLTGSDRPADLQMAQGQAGLFDAHAPRDPGAAALRDAVAAAEAATDTNPTDGQKEAGNYAKGKVDLHGQRISIETPKGAERSGIGTDGERWSVTMPASYGYFLGTEANDGDHVDVFVGPRPESGLFWVVNQVKPDTTTYDEPKVMLGYESAQAAQADYLLSFSGAFGGRVFGEMVGPFSVADLAKMLPTMRRNSPVRGDLASEGLIQRLAERDRFIAESKMHENATAPEHVKVESGVTVEELKQIAKEWREHIDGGGDADITHVFDAPAKKEVVRLQKKVDALGTHASGDRLKYLLKLLNRDQGVKVDGKPPVPLNADEKAELEAWRVKGRNEIPGAQAKVNEWKEHARAQYDDPKSRSANSQRVVLSLFDLSGQWSQPWADAGYQVYRFDIQDDPVVGDVNNFSTEFFNDWFGDFEGMDIYAILAATPCTDFASSGSRHFAAKDKDGRTVSSVRLVKQTLAAIEHFKPAVWALENPVGRIEGLTGLPPWRMSFQPSNVGDTYTKQTLLWGRFNGDLPIAPVEPFEGSKMWSDYGGKSMETKNARSETPEGFAYSFFMANNAIDHPVLEVAGKFDRLDRDLIAKALDAGVTPDEIESAVEDFYYMELDDDAANDAIRALLPAGDGPGKGKPEAEQAGEQLRLDIPEPKNWRTSYGAAQKYAEALGVNPRGEDGKYLKLPALVTAIEAKRGDASSKPASEAPSGEAVLKRLLNRFGFEPAVAPNDEYDQQIENGALTAHVQSWDPRELHVTRGEFDALRKIATSAHDTESSGLKLSFRLEDSDDVSDVLTVLRTSTTVGYVYMNVSRMRSTFSKPATAERKTVEATSLDDMRAALDAGYKVHFDYAGADGRTVWVERAEKGYVVKTQDDGDSTVWTKGGAVAGYSQNDAVRRALQDAEYRFTQWKPLAEQQGAVDQILADKVKTLTDRDVEQSQIEQAVAEYKDGDATLIDDLLRISQPEEQAADADADLDAMFDEVIAEETAAKAKPKREKTTEAPKAEPSDEFKSIAARLRVVPGEGEGVYLVRATPKDGDQGKIMASFRIGASGRPIKIEHSYNHMRDYSAYAIEQWAAANRPAAASKPRSAGKAAASAAKNTAAGIADTIAAMGKLFGGHGRLSSGLTFDEETYAKAKPLFKQAIAHFKDAGADLKEAMRAVVRMVLDQFGPHVAGNMKPYVVRFMDDVRTGKIDYDENVTNEGGPSDEHRGSDDESDAALDGVPAAEDGGSEGSGNVRVPGKKGRGRGNKRDSAADAARDDGEGGGGNGSAGVHPSAAGEVSAPNIPAENFVITDDVRLGKGGEVAKFNDNVAAIQILKRLAAERRRATKDEQRQLARYVGWGGLAQAFRNPQTKAFNSGWEARGEQLESLLTKRELASARSTTTDAHYTSQPVVQGMWSIAQRLGFAGGVVLEPSVGSGNFLGLVPEQLRGAAKFIGIEYDGLTADIAKALYPQASILQSGFERVPLPADSVDLAIGNPPFGKTSLYFPSSQHLNGKTIHNQFFLGSMDAVRPGGLQIMVVSRYLMDAKDNAARRELAEKANLVAAIRLPDTAFKENARTEVVTDILILQKHSPADLAYFAENPGVLKDATDPRYDWTKTDEVADPLGGDPITVNRYFAKHPDMILGVLERSGSMRHGNDVTVRAPADFDIAAALARAADRLPRDIMTQRPGGIEKSLEQFEAMRESLELTIGGFEEGNIVFDEDGRLQQVILAESGSDRDFLKRRPLTAESPWSPQLSVDAEGRWFREVPKLDEKGEKVKQGRFVVYEREVFPREQDVPETLRLGPGKFERLKALVSLRDTLKQQIVMETADEKSDALESHREQLKAEYEAFVKKHGLVGDNANQALLATMPDGPLVTALEMDYDAGVTTTRAKTTGQKPRKPSAKPAPIMTRRVVMPYVTPDTAANGSEALMISLAENGGVDLERMAELLKADVDGVVRELHDEAESPLIFKDPETQKWEVRDAYLSGQVVRKLAAAREAGLDKNVEALEKVQPEPIPSSDIGVSLGSTWVPADIYAEFLQHITGAPARVKFSKKLTAFDVSAHNDTPGARVTWGTTRAPAGSLIASMLNSKAIAVYDTYTDEYGNQRRTLNEEQTTLALAKAEEISNEFADWIMGEAGRRQRLAQIYNETFNNRVMRQFDGSHLTLPGKVPDAIIEMRRHQKNVIWRGISSRFLLIDHAVGAGKTFEAIARAMERRRMGLSQKPMIVVPNHMVEQFAADVYRLYPGARVLAMGKKDLEAKKRRRGFARIATGDWDIVIVPHSSFGFMGISPEREAGYLEAEIKEMETAVEEARREDSDGPYKPQSVKSGEAILKNLYARLEKIRDKKRDNLLTFEQLGVDDMTIDEAHEFKNLMYFTRLTKVLGLGSQQGSKKAYDLYNKVRALRDSPNGAVTFMTGTPISNSVVEMYTLMKYLAWDELIDYGIENFDAWHKQFADAVTKFEMNDVGRLTEKTRLSRWKNMPELMKLYYDFTDAVSLDDIKRWYKEDHGKDFPVPKVKGGGRRNMVVKPTAAQLEILDEVIRGFDALPFEKDRHKRNAERLRLMNRARNVALDARVAVPGYPSDEKGGKLDTVAGEIARIYHDWTADKGTQLVFLDRSVPKSKGDKAVIEAYDKLKAELDAAVEAGDQDRIMEVSDDMAKFDAAEIEQLRLAQNGGWNAYAQIKQNLIDRGIPAEQIRFIQEANTDEQKQQLFDMVKSGEVRVLIGSTPRMGAGTNVQNRLVALHHVDVNWKPSDIEQREGRIVRQGNELLKKYGDEFEVEVIAYATERTYDAKMWALNEAKGRFINSLRAYTGAREIEIDDEESENMAEMAALASGDPRMLERVQLDAEVKKLEMLRRSHNRRQGALEDSISDARKVIATVPAKIESAKADDRAVKTAIEAAEEERAGRTVEIEGETFSSYADAEGAAEKIILELKGDNERARFTLMVDGKPYTSKDAVSKAIRDALGDVEALPLELADGTRFRRISNAGTTIAQLLNSAIVDGDETVDLGTLKGLPLKAYIGPEEASEGGSQGALDIDKPVRAITLSVEGRHVRDALDVFTDKATGTASPTAIASVLASLSRGIGHGTSARYLERRLESARNDLPALEEQAGKPFPRQDEYMEKSDRLAKLEAELLIEGQQKASAPAAAAAPDEVPSVLSRRSADVEAVASVGIVEAEEAIAAFSAGFPVAPRVVMVDRFEDLPAQVQADARAQGSDEKTSKGAFHDGALYVVRMNHRSVADFEATLAHEMLGHFGLRRELGPEFVQRSNQLFLQIGGLNGLAAIAHEHGFGKEFADYVRGVAEARRKDPQRFTEQIAKLILTEEVYAHLAERRGGAWVKFRELIGRLRHWLRERGFMQLPNLNDADLLAHLGRIEDVLAGRRPDGGGPRGGGKAPATFRRGEDAAAVPHGTREQAEARGYVRAYRGVSQSSPFNDTGTAWLTTNREVAAAYAEEVFGYDDPAVMEVWYDPKAVPTYDMRKLSEEEIEALGPDEFGNPQALGIYRNADDSPLGGGYPHTVIHVPQSAAMAIDGEPVMEARNQGQSDSGLTPEQFRTALVDRFGEAGVKSLEDQGLLNVLEYDPDDLVAAAHMDKNNPAWYNPNTGEASFVPEFIDSAEEAVALVLHEVGAHHGLPAMLGERGWKTLKERVVELAGETKGDVAAAWVHVLDTYPRFAKYAQDPSGAAADDHFMHEVIARIGESAAGRRSSLWRDLLALVNRFLLKAGIGRQINKNELVDLVAGSLDRIMGHKGRRKAGRAGERMDARRGVAKGTADNWIDNPSRLIPEGVRAAPGRAVNAAADALPKKVGDYLRYLFDGTTAKTFNWYHKTIGSQFHKAKRDPEHYGRVFNLAQQFIDDVSRFGTEAADLAPDLLPKMDTVASAFREAKNFRRDNVDAEAIAAPIFDGTLYEENGQIVGKVWEPHELRSIYKLNERQIDLYFQFRAAVDHSLETLAIAEMTKVARAYSEAKNPDDIVLLPPGKPLSMNALAKHYSDQFVSLLEDAKKRLLETKQRVVKDREQLAQNAIALNVGRVEYHKMMLKKEAEDNAAIEALEKEVQELVDLRKAFDGKAATIRNLQQAGYAPLMRFGKYTVDVVQMRDALDDDGNEVVDPVTGEIKQEEFRPFFGMFESEREAQEVAAIMREEYPDATVTTGVGSEDGYQLFGSVSIDSLEALAKLAGKEEDAFVQKFYKEAVAQRSALKRLIHRKGIEGYSKDVTRTLAAFLMSNARATASAHHFGDLMRVASEIPKEKGDVKDEAVRLINYIRDPNEEAGMLRGLLFMHFLGGSIAAAAVNLTQTVMTTAPYLHQFGVGPKAMAEAAGMAVKRMRGKDLDKASKALREALERAENEGVVAPHNIHALMGQSGAQSFMNNRLYRLFSHVWGSFFGMAEQYNREVAFIAAFQAAEKMGRTGLQEAYARAMDVAKSRGLPAPDRAHFADPFAFAKNAVQETQFVLSKAARPNWARGAVGATLMTFRAFMIFYLELFKRLPNKERALMLGTLIVMAGIGGLPGADDLDDLIDTLGQSLGYNTNAERWKEEVAREVFGAKGAEFVLDGVSAFIPIELGSRLGMGNLLPATGVLKPSNAGRRGDVAFELLGAAGGYFKNLMDAADYLQRGRYGQAFAEAAMPKAIKDLAKAYEMAESGVYDDTRGRRVVDVSTLDAFYKATGFQPRVVSTVQKSKGVQMQDVSLFKAVKANIAELLAQAIHERDAEKRERALGLLADWNEKNPEHAMQRPAATAVARRVRAMQLDTAERMRKTTPKEMRELATSD